MLVRKKRTQIIWKLRRTQITRVQKDTAAGSNISWEESTKKATVGSDGGVYEICTCGYSWATKTFYAPGELEISPGSVEYDGTAQEPEVAVCYWVNGTMDTLYVSEDQYTVS